MRPPVPVPQRDLAAARRQLLPLEPFLVNPDERTFLLARPWIWDCADKQFLASMLLLCSLLVDYMFPENKVYGRSNPHVAKIFAHFLTAMAVTRFRQASAAKK